MARANVVALITGAGSGIGRALAIRLARRRALTILVGRRRDALQETKWKMPLANPGLCLPADLTSADDRARIVDRVQRIGRLDLLINNAGVIATAPFIDTEDGDMERMLATNVLAPFALTRDLVPLLRRSRSPRIVNIGSMFGDIAYPHFVGYSATKFALRGLSDGLRRELEPYGIGVTYVAPRAVRSEATPIFAHLIEPLGLKLDRPRDVARQILDAAAAGRRTVYPPGIERLFVQIARFCPRVVDRSIVGQFRRLARHRNRAETAAIQDIGEEPVPGLTGPNPSP